MCVGVRSGDTYSITKIMFNITNALLASLAFLALHPSSFCSKWIHSFAGPWRVQWDRFELGESAGLIVHFFRVSHPHLHDTQRFTGNITMKVDLTDELTLQVMGDSWSTNNMWKPNGMVLNLGKACSAVRDHSPDLFRKMFGEKYGQSRPCKVPAGAYVVRNDTIKWVSTTIMPVLPYGKWRIHSKFFKNTTVYGYTRAIMQILPKISDVQ